MKFKIGFTIDAEALFGLMAKMLPIDNLSVEELEPPARIAAARPTKLELAKPVARPAKFKRRGGKFDPGRGLNRVVLEALADGKPRTAASLKPVLQAAGFSPDSVSSTLDKLKRKGVVFQPEFGLWQIAAPREKAAE